MERIEDRVAIDIRLTEAEHNELAIADCCKNIKYRFLELGGLLADNQDRALWSEHHERFKDFVEMLGIGSYSWVTRLINISRIVALQLLTSEEVIEIGVSKACLLLPLARKGKLSEDIKELARNAPFRDLRAELRNEAESELPEEYLICPRCWADILFDESKIRKRK